MDLHLAHLRTVIRCAFFAGVAKGFGNGGILRSSVCVGFVGPVMNNHARWFATYLEGVDFVGGWCGSSKSVAVERAFSGDRR